MLEALNSWEARETKSSWCSCVCEKKGQSDEDQEGLKELICSSDCVRGQGETRVSLICLPPLLIPHLFIFLNLFLGIQCLIYLILSTIYSYIYTGKGATEHICLWILRHSFL